MEWINFDNGSTMNQIGCESGVIVRDSEHPLGARITLERDCKISPYSITCGIYGWMFHTRFFSTELEASQQFDLMAAALDSILLSEATDERLDLIVQFVDQFP
jgi:hypothetical protein